MKKLSRSIKVVMLNPSSDSQARMMAVLWAINVVLAVGVICMNLLMATTLSPFWILLNRVTGGFFGGMLALSIRGAIHRRRVARERAEFEMLVRSLVENDAAN